MRVLFLATVCCSAVSGFHQLSPVSCVSPFSRRSSATIGKSPLYMGLFDKFTGKGSANKETLDEQWRIQQEMLANRRKPKSERDKYFADVEKRRVEASKKQNDMWGWQTKQYNKGEDPINEWRKQREKGTISDLDNQYGDPKEIGGIPIPGASFGVGGEFGLGGKFDNGGRFDLRLPYADQGYVDEDEDFMKKLGSFFGGSKKSPPKSETASLKEAPKKKNGWF